MEKSISQQGLLDSKKKNVITSTFFRDNYATIILGTYKYKECMALSFQILADIYLNL